MIYNYSRKKEAVSNMEDFQTLSKYLHVTPNAVRQHYKTLIKNDKNWAKHVTFSERHKYNFDSKLTTKLIQSFKSNRERIHATSSISVQHELDAKTAEISRLMDLLHQQEQLSKTSESNLRTALNELHSTRKQLTGSKNELIKYKKTNQHGFWWKLFH